MKKWVICYSSAGHDKLTQYAATAVADIDPDGILRLRLNAQVIERSS